MTEPKELTPHWDGTSLRWRRPAGRCTRTGCKDAGTVPVKWRAYGVGDWMCLFHARQIKARFPWLIA